MFQPTKSIQSRMSDDDFESPGLALFTSIRDNDIPRLQRLIDALTPADLHERLEDESVWGMPLHVAAFCNSSAAVEILLSAGASPLALRHSSDDDRTPLEIAARQGNRAILRQLWQHIDPDHHTNNYTNFQSCLVYAAMYEQVPIVADLLSWWDGWSPMATEQALSWAAKRWQVYVVELLLSKFSFEQQTLDNALEYAASFKAKTSIFERIDNRGVDYLEQQQLIALLVDAGANPNSTLNRSSAILSAAFCMDLVGALKALLEKGADPNVTMHTGVSALHRLGFPVSIKRAPTKRGLHEIGIRLLLEKGASVLQENKSGETPIHYAACGSNLRILQLYLSAYPGDEVNDFIRSKNRHGETLLHHAAAGCSIEIIEYLLSDGGIKDSINQANSNGWTPFMCALAQTAVDGIPPVANCKTLLQVLPAVQLLLAHGADLLVVTAEGWTPLHCLALYHSENTSDETIQLIDKLISAGADVDACALFPFDDEPIPGHPRPSGPEAFGWGHQVEEVIKDPVSKRMIVRSGLTPLHFAATHGAVGVIEALLRHGANPEAEDSTGASPARTAGDSAWLRYQPEAQEKIITMLMGAGGSY
ncbi:ankyrin [Ilyonectria sp. MPI-CAGE-AT-0026]|nr:ankyrin [Ilyonectria sp. MPI-CAGE-AT-0026]